MGEVQKGELHKQVEDRTCEIDYEHDELEDEIDDLKDEIDALNDELIEKGNNLYYLKVNIKELYEKFKNKKISAEVLINELEALIK